MSDGVYRTIRQPYKCKLENEVACATVDACVYGYCDLEKKKCICNPGYSGKYCHIIESHDMSIYHWFPWENWSLCTPRCSYIDNRYRYRKRRCTANNINDCIKELPDFKTCDSDSIVCCNQTDCL